MNNIYTFNDPFFVGWERMNKRIEEAFKTNVNTTYPPYNVRKESDDIFVIELAVAGFNKDELSITEQDGTLTIEGNNKESKQDYLHKGIASRKFSRTFSLAEHVYVDDADLKDGILYVKIIREIPEEKKPKQITIK